MRGMYIPDSHQRWGGGPALVLLPTVLAMVVVFYGLWMRQVLLMTFSFWRMDTAPIEPNVYLLGVLAAVLSVWLVLQQLNLVSSETGAGFPVASTGLLLYALAEIRAWPCWNPCLADHHLSLSRDIFDAVTYVGFAGYVFGLVSVIAACIAERRWKALEKRPRGRA